MRSTLHCEAVRIAVVVSPAICGINCASAIPPTASCIGPFQGEGIKGERLIGISNKKTGKDHQPSKKHLFTQETWIKAFNFLINQR